ncbi:MAG: LysR family transcriptional regulator [Alphaproteobacteria bacterium]|nr:LysR family transcriptional regulator [Alphaproteobacteria bacterium]MDX5370477.1 LysR family transcriptional regulator [Alphaproteobacteria bacterium]MDX5464983.1 LysR family transcriptional regulator [Alphaproteobacteria bacterium]
MPYTPSLSAARGERLVWDLDWNLLRTFLVIMECQGITAAADRLGLKQPTVSNALRRLEAHVGRRLIDRGPNRFAPTTAGQRLYEECIDIFGSVSRLQVMMREVQEEVTGTIQIAMASHVVCPVLDGTLSSFHRQHPKAVFQLDVMPSEEAITSVLQKRASFAVCLVHRPDPRLHHTVLYREFFGFFCGPEHRLFGRTGLTLDDLRGETSVSFQTDRMTDALYQVAILRAKAKLDERIVGISSHLEEVRRMIVAGLGIGPLPLHVARADVEAGHLWRLPPYDDPPEVDIFIVTNPASNLNRAEQALLAMLMRRIADMPLEDRTYRA